MKKSPLSTLKGIVLGLIIVAVTYTVLAWTGPTQAPPNGNVPAPINAGASAQIKAGWLGIGFTSGTPSTTLDVNGTVRIRGGSPAAGKVLRSDGNGLATWVNPNPSVSMYTIIAKSSNNAGSQAVPGGTHDACFLGGMSHWDNDNGGPEKCKVGGTAGGNWNVNTYTQDAGSQTTDGDDLGALACFVTCLDWNL